MATFWKQAKTGQKIAAKWAELAVLAGSSKSHRQIKFLAYHITIFPRLGVSTEFELLKLKTCSLYHKNLLLQKVNVMIKYPVSYKKKQ